jgi:hypothetical protein
MRARHEDDIAAALTARLGLVTGDPVPRLNGAAARCSWMRVRGVAGVQLAS